MGKTHQYQSTVQWTGNQGTGSSHYRNYERSYIISIEGKSDVLGSSDPAFRGDKTKHNPEDLLVSSLSSCHMLWYLHVCSEAGVVVEEYIDQAIGYMSESINGAGQFTEVILKPQVTVQKNSMIQKANELHQTANEMCFIANSVNFPIKHLPSITSKE